MNKSVSMCEYEGMCDVSWTTREHTTLFSFPHSELREKSHAELRSYIFFVGNIILLP